ncbi:MAG: cell surface protein [bacterium]
MLFFTDPLRLAFAALIVLRVSGGFAQAFTDRVAEFHPGPDAGFGQDYFPANVLGPPRGNADPAKPNQSPADLLSLGSGGWIVLEFTNNEIVDGQGADFTVFENPFQPIGMPDLCFSETAIVSVSDDGTSWTTFPFDFADPGPPDSNLLQKHLYNGFAGLTAVYSSPANGISPFDPAVSGGDSFDLAKAGLSAVRFVRIQDTGTTDISPMLAPSGAIVNDFGNVITAPPTAGFDLDAVAAIHTRPLNAFIREWTLYE